LSITCGRAVVFTDFSSPVARVDVKYGFVARGEIPYINNHSSTKILLGFQGGGVHTNPLIPPPYTMGVSSINKLTSTT
jgi:hypothetical protein